MVFETEVIEIIQRTPDVKSFRFAAPGDVAFKPGQYLVLTIRDNGIELEKHFSLSSSPTEKGYVEFTKKITDHEFSRALERLRVHDWARIELPFGFFTFEGEYDRIACLCGGIGITAIRSICTYASDMRLDADIVLIYSNRTEQDIVFREELRQLEEGNPHFRVVHTLSRPAGNSWTGKTGRIDAGLIRAELPDYAERIFFVCGPPGMVDSLRSMLSDELRVKEDSIRWEHFLGYE